MSAHRHPAEITLDRLRWTRRRYKWTREVMLSGPAFAEVEEVLRSLVQEDSPPASTNVRLYGTRVGLILDRQGLTPDQVRDWHDDDLLDLPGFGVKALAIVRGKQ
jgi:hypothetical protein